MILPEEMKIELFKSKNSTRKSGEILYSVSLNRIKFTFYENLRNQNSFDNFFTPSSTEEDNKNTTNPEILSMIINFNHTNSSVLFATPLSCRYENKQALNKIGVKFLLSIYDLVTFYSDEVYYDYIMTNPRFNLKGTNEAVYEKIKPFFDLFGFDIFSSSSSQKNGNATSTANESGIVVFRGLKATNKLEEINIKYENIEYYHFDTKTYENVTFSAEEFNQNYYQIEKCVELPENSEQNGLTLTQFLLSEILK